MRIQSSAKMYERRTAGLFLIVVLASLVSAEHNPGEDGHKSCTDDEGNVIAHGQEFMPKISDPCTKCTCDNGYAILCHTAACSPPVGCVRIEQVPRECCKYHCLEADGKWRSPSANDSTPRDGHPATTDDDNITNLSLRLVASTVTSFLVLALLLFMVHRLRQRRLMMAMRRFEAQARNGHGDDDLDHYIPSEFMHIECPPYEDPPPPYSPPKPRHILPEDAPPPYEEVENSSDQLDPNGNNNNNNNNNQSCNNHGGERGVVPGNEDQHNAVIENQGVNHNGPRQPDIYDGLSSVFGVYQNSESALQRHAGDEMFGSEDSVDQTYLKSLAAVGENRGQNPREIQRSAEGCDSRRHSGDMLGVDSSSADRSEAVAAVRELHAQGANPDSRQWGVRHPGRSCSFSYSRSPEQDEISAIALAPMSHSYHATTADSGVQTLGSYTASLSRRKVKACGRDPVQSRQTISEVSEVPSGQRMIRKPIMECDSSIQNSHRLLQEELLRSLPPLQGGYSDSVASSGRVSRVPSSCANGAGSVPVDSQGNISPRPEPDGDDFSSPDHCPGATGHIPRSQSVTSTFSVCSETGEVRKKSQADRDGSVLQSDSQYPDHRLPSLHQPLGPSPDLYRSTSSKPSSESAVTKDAAQNLSGATDCIDGRPETNSRSSFAQSSRVKPVTNPPSQELRPGMASSRPHASKQKHAKKIHFVPLEKSKTCKPSKREKTKTGKKGIAAESHCEHTLHEGAGDGSASVSDVLTTQDLCHYSSEPRVLQSKSGDAKRCRSSTQPSVKQYGFLDHYVSPTPQVIVQNSFELEPTCRPPEYGYDPKTFRAGSNPYHTLPHQPHNGHNATRTLHPACHRRQMSHPAEKSSHVTPATLRPKIRPRPLSGGPMVEPGCDPVDPVAALPQNSIPRRRVKNIHAKKGRQSYPAQEGEKCIDRKALSGIDLGFVEPGPDHVRNPVVEQDGALGLGSKRRNGDRHTDRVGHNLFANGQFLESHLSSYV